MVRSIEDDCWCEYFATISKQPEHSVRQAYEATDKNVRSILRRKLICEKYSYAERPACNWIGHRKFVELLCKISIDIAIFTLARLYEVAHIRLCHTIDAGKNGKLHNSFFREDPIVDLEILCQQLEQDPKAIEGEIVLNDHPRKLHILQAGWQSLSSLNFDHLPRLKSLKLRLPGEASSGHEYAGIGGGGGSDVISASLLGHLLRGHGKEMNILISTRSSVTASQGNKGSKIGIKREVYNHDGPAMMNGKHVPGTYRVNADTWTSGRDLERIPQDRHNIVYIVLDQGDKVSENQEEENVSLTDRFRAVVSQQQIDTIIVVDTGGDVFGTGAKSHSTPDQDLRAQQAVSELSKEYNVVTAVLAVGVDAPDDAPKKALEAGGAVYKPTKEEKRMLLDLVSLEYRMDGSDDTRYGKTTLALQASLNGHVGWTSINLPEHVVDTWENPWSSFVYIRECMSDIILMPLMKLLPLIDQPA